MLNTTQIASDQEAERCMDRYKDQRRKAKSQRPIAKDRSPRTKLKSKTRDQHNKTKTETSIKKRTSRNTMTNSNVDQHQHQHQHQHHSKKKDSKLQIKKESNGKIRLIFLSSPNFEADWGIFFPLFFSFGDL